MTCSLSAWLHLSILFNPPFGGLTVCHSGTESGLLKLLLGTSEGDSGSCRLTLHCVYLIELPGHSYVEKPLSFQRRLIILTDVWGQGLPENSGNIICFCGASISCFTRWRALSGDIASPLRVRKHLSTENTEWKPRLIVEFTIISSRKLSSPLIN